MKHPWEQLIVLLGCSVLALNAAADPPNCSPIGTELLTDFRDLGMFNVMLHTDGTVETNIGAKASWHIRGDRAEARKKPWGPVRRGLNVCIGSAITAGSSPSLPSTR